MLLEVEEEASFHSCCDDIVIPVEISTLPLRNLPSADNIDIEAV